LEEKERREERATEATVFPSIMAPYLPPSSFFLAFYIRKVTHTTTTTTTRAAGWPTTPLELAGWLYSTQMPEQTKHSQMLLCACSIRRLSESYIAGVTRRRKREARLSFLLLVRIQIRFPDFSTEL